MADLQYETGWKKDKGAWRPPTPAVPTAHMHGLNDLGSDVTSRLAAIYQPITLAYAEKLTNQTGIGTSNTDITGLTVTITVPAGRRIRISARALLEQRTSAGLNFLYIYEGSTQLGEAIQSMSALDNYWTADPTVVLSPSAGPHTYKVVAKTSANTVDLLGDPTFPAFILAEDITGSSQPYVASSVPVGQLGYAPATTNQGSIAGPTDVTGLTVTVVVPDGRVLRITTKLEPSITTTGDQVNARIFRDSTQIQEAPNRLETANGAYAVVFSVVDSPSAGQHTYKVQLGRDTGAGTVTNNASTTSPSFILVEDITPTPSTAQGAPSSTLAYVPVTANQGSIAAATETSITGLNATFTVPAGRLVRVTVEAEVQSTSADAVAELLVMEGVGGTRYITADHTLRVANQAEKIIGHAVISPTAGTHTYIARVFITAGTGTVAAAANNVAFLLVEDITGSIWPAGSQVTAGLIASESWTTYTPALTAGVTNPTLGTGAVANGRYQKLGRVVTCQFYIKFGSAGTAAGSGIYRISLPVTAASPASAPTRTSSFPMGIGWGFNGVNNLTYAGVELVTVSGVLNQVELRAVTTPTVITAFTDAVPFVWGANMELIGSLTYEAAS